MTDTPLDLDAIEARAEAATDGPWLASPCSCGIGVLVADFHKRPDDARFAAHARTDVPALVAALRKAEAQVAAVLALADGWTLPERQPFEPLPSERAAGLNAAARAIRAALGGAS